jgi:hypothetical protein
MDRARLIKWDDEEAKSRGWKGGMEELAQDVSHPVEDLKSFWWIDDEHIDWDITPTAVGPLEEITGFIVIRDRVYATTVTGVVLKRTDKEVVFETADANLFF